MLESDVKFVRTIIKKTLLKENVIVNGSIDKNYPHDMSDERRKIITQYIDEKIKDFNEALRIIVYERNYPYISYCLENCIDDLLKSVNDCRYTAKGMTEVSLINN